jgi:hypothetical protein
MFIPKMKIGDKVKIPSDARFHPERGHSGKVVWIAEDEKSVAIKCDRRHNGKTSVFLMEINTKK